MNTKLAYAMALVLFAARAGVGADEPSSAAQSERKVAVRAPRVPDLSRTHRQFLMSVARRTLADAALGREAYEPGYVPAALEAIDLEVVLRLRERGFLFATASAGPAPITRAVRDAALLAARNVLGQDQSATDLLADPLIEIETVGPVEPIPVNGDWTQPRVVDEFIEPGVHGLVIQGGKAGRRFCPSELITSGLVMSEVLGELARQTHADQSQLPKTKLARFRSLFFYQTSSSDPVVTLQRGLTVLPQDAVSRDVLDLTIERLADYLVYRQLDSGLFAYLYDAASDRYTDEDNVVRQVGATLAICLYAGLSGKSAVEAACARSLRHHMDGVLTFPGHYDAAFIATPDGENKLGVTALFSLALGACPNADAYKETRRRLIQGVLLLQRESGMFVTAFPPAIDAGAQDYFPGEALLALADYHHDLREAAILDAFDKAIEFYRGYFRDRPSPAFVPWQVQAYAAIAEPTKRQDYVEFVFELTDWLLERQMTITNSEWPELRGGIASYQPGRAGVATASYLEALCDALHLARAVGDAERIRRYESGVRAAVRFVLQLQVRPEEAYFMRSPRDAVWGVRTSPALNLLRIDHVQHALVALIKARQVLYSHD